MWFNLKFVSVRVRVEGSFPTLHAKVRSSRVRPVTRPWVLEHARCFEQAVAWQEDNPVGLKLPFEQQGS